MSIESTEMLRFLPLIVFIVALLLAILFSFTLNRMLANRPKDLPEFKGHPEELVLYRDRVYFLAQTVGGIECAEIAEQQSVRGEDIEPTVVLYHRGIELLRDAAQRVHDDPERYSGLVKWKNEATLHGKGRPTVEEALYEIWISEYDDAGYCSMLDELTNLRRSQGRMEEAEQWNLRKKEAEELGYMLGQMSHASIQRLRAT